MERNYYLFYVFHLIILLLAKESKGIFYECRVDQLNHLNIHKYLPAA